MYAIVDIRGKQFQVQSDARIKVPLIDQEIGSSVEFDRVLMVVDDKETRVGTPVLDGATISAEIEAHGRFDKVINFVKKRRKGYSRKKGHRQDYTLIHVKKLNV